VRWVSFREHLGRKISSLGSTYALSGSRAAAIVLPLQPGKLLRQGLASAREMSRFTSYTQLRKVLFELALASVVINILNLALPLALLTIYDRIIPHKSASTLSLLMAGVVVALVLEAGVRVCRSYLTGWIGASFEHRLSCAAFRRLLDTAVADFERDGASAHIERMRAASLVRDFYSGHSLLSLFDLPFILFYLTLIGMLAGWLVLVPIFILGGFVLAAGFNARGLKTFVKRRSEFEERRFGFISQTLAGIHSVKTMAMEAMMERRYEMLQDTNAQQNFDGSSHSIAALNVSSFFSQLSTFSVVAAGAVMVIHGHLTTGALAACITLVGRCMQPVMGALSTWVRFQGLLVAQQQVTKLFDLPVPPNLESPPLPEISGRITLENVSFSFPGAKTPLFAGLTLDIAEGECIAVKGDSGSGKTTLLSLIGGVMTPTEGRILVDGQDLCRYRPASIPAQIGYLPQQGMLFDGTILENLTMFDSSLEPVALEIATQMGLDDNVAAMRNGYATQVGNSAGESVPGGIKQRISIARALVRRPQVILFDEANIALDSAGDDQLVAYLQSQKGKKTILLVSHRPSLVKMADRVLYLTNGKLSAEAPDHEAERKAPVQSAASRDPSPLPPLVSRPVTREEDIDGLFTRFRRRSDLSLCVPHLLRALAWAGSPRQLAEVLPHAVDLLDLDGLRRTMAGLGYSCTSRPGRLSDLDPRSVPCLFLPDEGMALLVTGGGNQDETMLFDPATNSFKPLADSNHKGRFMIFRPVETTPQSAGSWILSIMMRFRGLMWAALVLTILANVMGLSAPLFIMLVYGTVIPGENVQLIPYLFVGLLIVLAADWLLRGLRARLLAYMGARAEFIVGTAILRRILALPAWATEQTPVGVQVSRIKEFESLRDMFVGPLALLLYEIPGILVFIIALGMIDGWLLATLAGAMVGYFLLGLAAQPGVARRTLLASQAAARRHALLADATSKMRAIKYSGGEESWFERYRVLCGKAMAAEFQSQQFSGIIATTAHTLGFLTALAIITTCIAGTFSGTVALGAVVAAMVITWRLIAPLQNGFLSLATLVRVSRSAKQVDNLMRLQGERDSGSARQVIPGFRGGISFHRASFRYSNDSDPVLLGINFNVEPGQVVAIAGPNGSGKSTLLKLITGIYQPQAGSVRLDNVDIRQLDPGALRSLLSYAPQRCDVFYGTIAQNLRFAFPTASDEELRWATRLAGLYDDIMAMPENFNTRVFDGQTDQLPQGFRQRLSLARAYLKPSRLLLFDEPGNGLDADGDRAFHDAIEQLRGTVTIFIVSHRPSHLRLADTVVYLESGYVRGVGRYDDITDLI